MIIEKLVNITKKYDTGKIALNQVNLEILEKEIFTLIGPNGAGKTTLLKIMALIDTPTRGEVYFREQLITHKNIEKIRKKVTMVFQKPVFFNTTVFKNIAYGLKLRGYSRVEIENKVKAALKMVRLEGFENRHISSLSGGEQQRVALARAIILDPELLLLDEPLANIDPVNVAILEKTIIDLRKRTTIVMTTHDISYAAKIADKIAFVNDGRIIQKGETYDIFNQPIDVHTAKFVGYENIFEGVSEAIDNGYVIVRIGNVSIEAVSSKQGKCYVAIRPEDITIFKKKTVTSARNILPGKIIEIKEFGPFVHLKVDVDGTVFSVKITRRSLREMNLKTNDNIFLAFKASAVKVF